jgi:hypothetical protein
VRGHQGGGVPRARGSTSPVGRAPCRSLFPQFSHLAPVPSLLAVEHVEEDNKPMLYLVRAHGAGRAGWGRHSMGRGA